MTELGIISKMNESMIKLSENLEGICEKTNLTEEKCDKRAGILEGLIKNQIKSQKIFATTVDFLLDKISELSNKNRNELLRELNERNEKEGNGSNLYIVD